MRDEAEDDDDGGAAVVVVVVVVEVSGVASSLSCGPWVAHCY